MSLREETPKYEKGDELRVGVVTARDGHVASRGDDVQLAGSGMLTQVEVCHPDDDPLGYLTQAPTRFTERTDEHGHSAGTAKVRLYKALRSYSWRSEEHDPEVGMLVDRYDSASVEPHTETENGTPYGKVFTVNEDSVLVYFVEGFKDYNEVTQ